MNEIGAHSLIESLKTVTTRLQHLSPIEFNEKYRYIPKGVSPITGYMRFSVNPFMREVIDCFDVRSPVREVNIMKGAQVTYTTVLESIVLYALAGIGTVPCLFATSDDVMKDYRMSKNIIPMLTHSNMMHIVQSLDPDKRSGKRGLTMDSIEVVGGGFCIFTGIRNPTKARQNSVMFLLDDEIDAWLLTIGRDGCPVTLLNSRTAAYHNERKICRGSTPTLTSTSKIWREYQKGDQREYRVCCLNPMCRKPQAINWIHQHMEGVHNQGFSWEMKDDKVDPDSVRYHCVHCGYEHIEADKIKLLDPAYGAEWVPTANAAEDGVRSYKIPALISPSTMRPWIDCINHYLRGFDPIKNRYKDLSKYQIFVNNILGEPFEASESKLTEAEIYQHQRSTYVKGQVPNEYSKQVAGAHILFLTCTMDVGIREIYVATFGWTVRGICFLIDYEMFETESHNSVTEDIFNPIWDKIRDHIENKQYYADDGRIYPIPLVLIDASYIGETVIRFCAENGYDEVYPIFGHSRHSNFKEIKEFAMVETSQGIPCYRINVDNYKDRMSGLLRQDWDIHEGYQKQYQFNLPDDITQAELKELCREYRVHEVDERTGDKKIYWKNVEGNELWDLFGYAHASMDILANRYCIGWMEEERVNYERFWDDLVEKDPYPVKPETLSNDYEDRMKRYADSKITSDKVHVANLINKLKAEYKKRFDDPLPGDDSNPIEFDGIKNS